jgi:DNA-binding transcriptional ArsR family regulator
MEVEADIRDIRNDIDRIKQDIDSINRVQVLANSPVIIQDVRDAVGRSRQMIATLFIARDWISAGELATQLRIDPNNLNKVVGRLLDRGLLYNERRGKSVFYRRTSRIDLVGIETMPEFKDAFDEWRQSR